jgi:hypothetical protein
MRTDRILEAARRWAELRGSTRPAALMRVGLGLIVLVRFADEVSPFQADNAVLAVHGLGLMTFAVLSVLGWRTRASLSGLAAFLGLGYFGLGGAYGHAGWYHHHVYLLFAASFLLAFIPCGRSYSLDRLRALDAGRAPPETGDLRAQRLIGLQLSAIYFWAAVDKTDLAFLSGERLEQTLVWVYAGRWLHELLTVPALLVTASIAVVVVEYLLAVAIHLPRWRPVVLGIGLALHATFYLLLPVDTYSVTMALLYLALLDPDGVHRFLDRLQRQEAAPRTG